MQKTQPSTSRDHKHAGEMMRGPKKEGDKIQRKSDSRRLREPEAVMQGTAAAGRYS